jgi:tRNA wybutosine-synthesizing protein 4
MLKHFEKLRTPLRSIHKYPSLNSQNQRFSDAGWDEVTSVNLWELWSDPGFLAPSQRLRLDSIEPFDEWEEFALFAAHYFLLTARIKPEPREKPDSAEVEAKSATSIRTASDPDTPVGTYGLKHVEFPKSQGLRRNGTLWGLPDETGQDDTAVAHHGGMTCAGRTASSIVYRKSISGSGLDASRLPPLRIPARQCHTITKLRNGDSILIGGRTSPSAAMQDCYMHTKSGWEPIQDLPCPRFRHSAAAVLLPDLIPGILVVGGKSATDHVEHDVLLWDRAAGWRTLQVFRHGPQPGFGTTFIALGDGFGILSGGMRADGVVLQDTWKWKFVYRYEQIVAITFTPCSLKIDAGAELFVGRFGASYSLVNGQLLLIGGISSSGCIRNACEILSVDVSNLPDAEAKSEYSLRVSIVDPERNANAPRLLLVGHASLACTNNEVLIAGGGAVCFSFGTYWNPGLYILHELRRPACLDWSLLDGSIEPRPTQKKSAANGPPETRRLVERTQVETEAEFLSIIKHSQPKILENLDFGPCRTLWTKNYLLSKIGTHRPVVIHEAQSKSMNFQRKDFAYVTKPFGIFLEEVYNGAHQYLRSIASSEPSKRAANLDVDFPEIAQDFRLPPVLRLVADTYHSSSLRVTGDVAMWLHVDTMANVLCQIDGSKRLILFPPADMVNLGFPPGSTTSSLEIFEGGSADDILSVPGTHPVEVALRPGEVLFIPPLWAHAAAAPLQKVSIAVNVFFRSLARGYAAGKDVYGNRDLEAYENGRRDVDRIVRAFDGVPSDLAHAYLLRLADELKTKAERYAPVSEL